MGRAPRKKCHSATAGRKRWLAPGLSIRRQPMPARSRGRRPAPAPGGRGGRRRGRPRGPRRAGRVASGRTGPNEIRRCTFSVDEPHLVEACRGREVGSGQREVELDVSVGFDQSGRRRLGCGERRNASRREHRFTAIPTSDGHGHGPDHERGRSRRRDQCPPEHPARPGRPDRRCHRGRDRRAPPPRRAHRRHPRRRDRAAVPGELPGVLGRGPHSHAPARGPRRRRNRWVAQVPSTVDARWQSSRTPTLASVPCSSTGKTRSTRQAREAMGTSSMPSWP